MVGRLHRVGAVLGWAFVLGLVARSVLAHSGGEVVSKQANEPIEIDGILDEPEWTAALAESSPHQDITTEPQDWYQVVEGGGAARNSNDGGLRVSRGTIDGDEDLLVRWATVWDAEYLYFGFDVIDDNPNVDDGSCDTRSARNFDAIWLCFDTLHDALELEFDEHEFNTADVAAQSTYAADDTYWIFVPLNERVDGCVFDPSQNADAVLNDPLQNIVQGEITETGYTAEMRIPWSSIATFMFDEDFLPEDGLTLGFDITVMDVDGDPPTYDPPFGGAMAWSSDFENDNSPGVLGDLILSEEIIGKVDEEGPKFKRGDVDANGSVNIADGVSLLNYLFGGGAAPTCADAADTSDAGQLTIASAVFVLNFLFSSGAAPPAPGHEECGPDPTEDALDCAGFGGC